MHVMQIISTDGSNLQKVEDLSQHMDMGWQELRVENMISGVRRLKF